MTAVRDIKQGERWPYTIVRFFCDGKGPKRKGCDATIAVDDDYSIHYAWSLAKNSDEGEGWWHSHGRHLCPECYGSGFGRGLRDDAFDSAFELRLRDGRRLKGAGFLDRRREELGFGHPYNDRPGTAEARGEL